MPREKILTLLHEALSDTRAEGEQVELRLLAICRDEQQTESTEQVVALGFLACARALREASLVQEIAVREEIQELQGLIAHVLTEVTRMQETVRGQVELQQRRRRTLADDLSPGSRPENIDSPTKT
jgi:hypothetical protein